MYYCLNEENDGGNYGGYGNQGGDQILFPWGGESSPEGYAQTDVNWGDFYYPILGNMEAGTSFSYRVNLKGRTNYLDAIGNLNTPSSTFPNITLYAREWAPKYVTKFYTDPDLTQEVGSDFTPGIHAYMPIAQTGDESIYLNWTTRFGTELSAPSNGRASNGANPGGTINDFSRKWWANFDGSGEKEIGSAKPNVYPSFWNASDGNNNTGTTN